MISTTTLKKIALGGVFVVAGMGIFVQSRIRSNFCKQGFCSKPLEILKGYAAGNEILGKPIYIKKVDLLDTKNNWTNGVEAKVAIPLAGSRASGYLHAWSTRPTGQTEWLVQKVDLEIHDKRWTFYIHPSATDKFKLTQGAQSTKITDQSNQTTDHSNQNRDQSNQTIYQSNQATDQSNQTTAHSSQNTAQSNQTTDQSNQNRDQSNQTTDQSNQTTDQSNQSTDQSNQITDQSNQTTDQAAATSPQTASQISNTELYIDYVQTSYEFLS